MPRIDDYSEYEKKIAAFYLLKAEVLPLNKAALFEVLNSTGIDSITVCFDGSGDSGQMEEIVAFIADGTAIDLPAITVEYRDVTFSCPAVSVMTQPLGDVLESITYELLEKTHDGWENGDGAEASFTFKVADRSITLDYHERYITTEFSRHEF